MIVEAGARHASGIAAVWNPVIRDSAITFNAEEKSENELVRLIVTRIDAGHGFFVAEEAGEVLGFATYAQFRGGVGYARAMEHTVILAPEARGKGLGRALMAAVEDHARARGVHSMTGGISGENEAGIAFHAALGYGEVARVPQVGWKFDRWMDLVLMQKFL
ncbi:GNAT family N-acetyltransferase [Sinisalibacter aestuarii]|uniref:N-acetyltransferase n=1 Tax=Sinisalibacter aestuarii TaxID=2949426 RepID=A0ABQ5LTM6_9RHOB|nr:GNAT family N-acetyltransferase [Sinisalibacter aestuarii]GKY88336.1 N-acetyltransferase [Sinisalibacter aestuarii]